MSSTETDTKPTYEYKTIQPKSLWGTVIKSGKISEEKLNKLGENGWELVTTAGPGTSAEVFIFKRPAGVFPEESSGWFS